MALRDQPYLPLYVKDFMTDEALNECSAESTGVYIRIMCLMHKSKEYGTFLLKEKDKQNSSTCYEFATPLVRACYEFAEKLTSHLPYKVDVIARSLQELIENEVLVLEGDKILQKRMIRDFEKSNVKADNGRQGGLAKSEASKTSSKNASKNLANTESEYVNENENEFNSEVRMIVDSNNKKESAERKQKKSDTFTLFDKFYAHYPRKTKRPDAERSFNKIKMTEELFDKIMTSLDGFKKCRDWKKDNGQFIPYPATWLNARQWEDDVPKENAQSMDELPNEYCAPEDWLQ